MSLFLSRLFGKSAAAPAPHTKAAPDFYAHMQSYVHPVGAAQWSNRNYAKFAEEAYRRNVIANRAITLVARGAASVSFLLYGQQDGVRVELEQHPLLSLLARPNPFTNCGAFFEALYSYMLLSGNAYVQAVSPVGESPRELHLLRPDRVSIQQLEDGRVVGYHYNGEKPKHFPVDALTGNSRILHVKFFNPLDGCYGLSPVEAAAYSIDQHNQAAAWNQALLQNGARPSGALVVRGGDNGQGYLSEDQYFRMKQQIDEQFSGAHNAGRPLLLEGGLEWREMSISPREMDFIEAKHSSARDIALAFGVPPQMLGIPGDNTYSNLAEARMALWEQTILPLVDMVMGGCSGWFSNWYGEPLTLTYDADAISALAPRRDYLWKRMKDADFLTDEEKRATLGYA